MNFHETGTIDDGWCITIIRDRAEIETIRPIWEQLQSKEPYPVINVDVDRYLSAVKALGDGVEPYIMLAKNNGQAVAMVIGRTEKLPFRLRLGYKTLFEPKLRRLTVVHGGIIGQRTSDVCGLLIHELMAVLRRREVDMVYFNHLRTDSNFYPLALTIPNFMCRGHFSIIEPHWSMSLPESMDLFYARRSKKHRANLRRCIRKLEEKYPDSFDVVTYTRVDELNEAVKAAAEISHETYQHALGRGISGNSQTLDMLTTEARHGWLELSILFLGGQPCAFQHGCRYKSKYFLEQIGFDPKWGKYNIGTVLFLKVLENMCGDHQVERLDFGFGNAEYKRSFGDSRWDEASVYIFAPRLYPLTINLLQTVLGSVSLVLKCIVHGLHSTDKIKRRWRDFLRKSNKW